MEKFILDGLKIKDRDDLFVSLKKQIKSDEFYGNNLDALWDVLTTLDYEFEIVILNEDELKDNLGTYYDMLLDLLNDLKIELNKRDFE